MLEKIIGWLMVIVFCGVASVVFSLFITFFLSVLILFAMLPVAIIFNESVAERIVSNANFDILFKIVYTLTFISIAMEALEIPGPVKPIHRWWKRRAASRAATKDL